LADRGVAEKRTFSYDEAVALLPEVREITEKAYRQVEELRAAVGDGPRDAERFELEATAIVNDWATRVRFFGIEVKGIWLVDFDNGFRLLLLALARDGSPFLPYLRGWNRRTNANPMRRP
jgi:hypothetical protein